LLRQTLLFFNYFLPYFLHNRKQNRGYDTATQSGEGKRKMKRFKHLLTLPFSAEWRGLMKRKEFKDTPHFYSLPQGERREKREIYLIKSILFVFVNFGVFKV
jgi:hypothetical protein